MSISGIPDQESQRISAELKAEYLEPILRRAEEERELCIDIVYDATRRYLRDNLRRDKDPEAEAGVYSAQIDKLALPLSDGGQFSKAAVVCLMRDLHGLTTFAADKTEATNLEEWHPSAGDVLEIFMPLPEDYQNTEENIEALERPEVIYFARISQDGRVQRYAVSGSLVYWYTAAADSPAGEQVIELDTEEYFQQKFEEGNRVDTRGSIVWGFIEDMHNMSHVPMVSTQFNQDPMEGMPPDPFEIDNGSAA